MREKEREDGEECLVRQRAEVDLVDQLDGNLPHNLKRRTGEGWLEKRQWAERRLTNRRSATTFEAKCAERTKLTETSNSPCTAFSPRW